MLVKYNHPNIRDAYGLKFYPGVNDVDPAKWDRAMKDPEIANLVEDGKLVVLKADESKSEEEGKTVSSLKGYSKKKALDVIKSTFNYEMLALWKASDDRPEVIVAIEKQIAEMKEDAKKKDGAK
jgi:hypothetical protein